jgi:hypothetical protein
MDMDKILTKCWTLPSVVNVIDEDDDNDSDVNMD